MKKEFFTFLILLFCLSCENEKTSQLKQFEWLQGIWIGEKDDAVLTETWKKNGDEFEGLSIVVIGPDTVFSEKMFLQEIDDTITYTVYLKENSDGVAFKLKDFNGKEAVFENKENDFPQRIIYMKPLNDSLYARIEGEQGGNFSKEEFFFRREK